MPTYYGSTVLVANAAIKCGPRAKVVSLGRDLLAGHPSTLVARQMQGARGLPQIAPSARVNSLIALITDLFALPSLRSCL